MVESTLASTLADKAVKQIPGGFKHKKGRMDKVKELEDAYNNDDSINQTVERRGGFHITMPVLSGFIDTLVSKLNDWIKINFDKQEEADLKKSQKITGKWEYDSSPARGAWRIKDLIGKKMAAISGVAIFYKASAKIEGKFIDVLRNVDHSHFYCEPKKGYDLEWHRYLGETNIWKTASDLDKGVEGGLYDKDQVEKLKQTLKDDTSDLNISLTGVNDNRYRAMKLDVNVNYEGEDLYCLTNHFMEYEGKRYYVFIDYNTGIWIRVEELSEIFSPPTDHTNPLWPYKAWHTHPDVSNFWSKGPADDVLSVHDQIGLILSLAFTNLKQRTMKKRAIDPEIFPDASEIEDEITQIIEVNPLMQGKSIGEGVYEFKTEDNTRIIVNLVTFLNNFLGEQTGITPAAKGSASEDLATVYVGNIQQVADRMSLYSEFYKQCWAMLGLLYFIGVKDNFVAGQFVKVMGLNGYEFEELLEDDTIPFRDFDINITGGLENAEATKEKDRLKSDSLLIAVKEYKEFLNPKKSVEFILRSGGWEEDSIKELQDTDLSGDRMILSEAAEAMQKIMLSKEDPKTNKRANEAFVMKIINWADDHEDTIDNDKFEQLYAYAFLHIPIVARNSARRATMLATMQNLGQFPGASEPGANVPAGRPAQPGTPTQPGATPVQPGPTPLR